MDDSTCNVCSDGLAALAAPLRPLAAQPCPDCHEDAPSTGLVQISGAWQAHFVCPSRHHFNRSYTP